MANRLLRFMGAESVGEVWLMKTDKAWKNPPEIDEDTRKEVFLLAEKIKNVMDYTEN